ncbi:EamA/RhaT family transporter [Citrobacter portucalensis]|uniref:DMT family transporter n=1 Tax=Citrobacter freundii complex TaxID=1344959 RepID=UPI00065153C8|nr:MULTISPECIES: DMT family transporter [Citrobacter freundii complex]QNM20999.1 DMT family transporter [Citrobacter freundii]MCX9043323.1 DMT family transporter [Citrobacter portucalensis]MCX9067724.1 DMT family transporter [Citrobacter portucalensis]MEB7914658.1 DMT family transporter [Citrobacter portucalensis]PKQ50814.1 EamA/RhaT family transporter [Citrobacter portucalensis]
MISGVLYALLAGLMWGLIFVGPLIVPEYPAVLQSMGRYLALGLIALPIAWLGRARLRQLVRKDWVTALTLTMMGNLIYYVCLASAIQRTGAPVSTMIIGTLPVVIPVFANLLYSQRDGKLSWWRLSPALVLIGIGLLCVNISELNQGLPDFSGWRYGSGIVLALVSVVCWAWYALRNARWLRENPDKHPMMWATAQALVTLPVSLLGYIAACLWLNGQTPDFALPFGPRPGVFIGLMIAIAVLCSWVGALCWNVASQKLPTVILGPLIVFETLAGLLYTFILREEFPPLLTVSGIALLMVGVVIAVRAKPQKPSVVVVSQS